MDYNSIENIDDFADLIPSLDTRGINLGLKRIQAALKEIGEPCSSLPAIQIAGTNGKGSISSFISSSLSEAGFKIGLFTSPHLVSWCERISVNGENISTFELRERLSSLQQIAHKHNLTPFELLLAAAFQYFEFKEVEIMVLEVGLGGRLDATTAHCYRPVIALGSIGLDHCEYLGNSVREIAIEKAAVITPGSIVISAKQHPDVEVVLKKVAERNGAALQWVKALPSFWELGLSGLIQRENAAVAKAAIEALSPIGFSLTDGQIRDGLAKAYWPARLQTFFWNGLPVLIDGAHNPNAAKRLSEERKYWDFESMGVIWILGIQANKDGPEMLKNLLKPIDKAWIIPVPGHYSWTKKSLSDACNNFYDQLFEARCVEEVLNKLLLIKQWPCPSPVIAGSLYLIGELISKRLIKDKK